MCFRSTFKDAVADDSDDMNLLENLKDNPIPKRRRKPLAKTNSLNTRIGPQPIYENQKDYLRKQDPKARDTTPKRNTLAVPPADDG